MLTKRQARTFFLGGTILFSAVFIFLTIDTINQTAERTNEQNLTDDVKAGKHIWDRNNCMGCHTILGEGGYYAPELTKVYERRGPEFIRVFMRDPEAMFPGERKMPQYELTEEEMDQLIAFFKWVGEIDTNGWPPEPDIDVGIGRPSVAVSADQLHPPQKFQQLCVACHSLGGEGGNVGPALDGVGSRLDREYLQKWIANPQAVKPGTAMPRMPLTDAERGEIVDFLASLK
ncbi:MAG: c-type cytochrome [Leptospiraceae bacterium]|nr:c-type cytochrome [Leptospiraceae bacterium]